MFSKTMSVENALFSSRFYLLLVASLGLGTVSLGELGTAKIRIWEILLCIFAISVVLKYCLGKRFISPNKTAVILVSPLMMSVLLSGLQANRYDLWAKQTLLLTLMLLLFAAVSQRRSRMQIAQNLRWIIYPGVLIAGWGIVELLFFPANLQTYWYSSSAILPRARSFFAEANEFSQFLALPFGFLFSAILYYRNAPSWERWFFGLGLLLVILAQVLTFSRGGVVAFASEILAWFAVVLLYGIGERRRFQAWKLLFLIVLLIAVAYLLADFAIIDIITGFFARIQSLVSGGDVTTMARWESIVAAISNNMNSPLAFVFGVGMGNLPTVLGESAVTTSNLFVDVFSELGFLGLLSFLFITGAALILPLYTLKHLKRRHDDEMLAVFFGAYLSLIGLIIGGLTYATQMLNVFWLPCGLLLSLYQYHKVYIANERKQGK